MQFRQRVVKGYVVDGDGNPIINSAVEFVPTLPVSYTLSHIIVDKSFTAQTDEDGYFEITIWAEEEDSLIAVDYKVYFPIASSNNADKNHSATFSLEYGNGQPVWLASLIALSTPTGPNVENLTTLIDQRIVISLNNKQDSLMFLHNGEQIADAGEIKEINLLGNVSVSTDGDGLLIVTINGGGGGGGTVDQTLINGSTNAVSGNAVFDGLAALANTVNAKQSVIQFQENGTDLGAPGDVLTIDLINSNVQTNLVDGVLSIYFPQGTPGGALANGNAFLLENETLAQAITRLDDLEITLELYGANNITADLIIPENISLKLFSQTYFTSSNSSKLTIRNGSNFTVALDQEIFRGNLDVIFDRSYPLYIVPNWWTNGRGDDRLEDGSENPSATDNLPAVNKAIRSMRSSIRFASRSAFAHGGHLKFLAQPYYCSNNVKCPVTLEISSFAGMDFGAGRVRFAPNKKGFIIGLGEMTDFEQPQPYPRNGDNSQIHDIFLLGDFAWEPDAVNCSISGLTITLPNDGTVYNPETDTEEIGFSYRHGWGAAEFVKIGGANGRNWAIAASAGRGPTQQEIDDDLYEKDDIVPVKTLQLRPFAFTAFKSLAVINPANNQVVNTATLGNQIVTDRYIFPQTWVGATVEIQGRAYTITAITDWFNQDGSLDNIHCRLTLNAVVPHGVHGHKIIDVNGNEFPLVNGVEHFRGYPSAEGRVTALPAHTADIMLMRGCAIDIRSAATVRNVGVRRFGGDGLYMGLLDPTKNSGAQPNASNTIIENLKVDYSQGSAYNCNYANGNVISAKKINSNYNEGYGVSAESQLGETHEGHHASFNGQYNYIGGIAQPNNGSVFRDCYSEDGGCPILTGGSTICEFGTLSRFSIYDSGVKVESTITGNLNVSGLSVVRNNPEENSGMFYIEQYLSNRSEPFYFEDWRIIHKGVTERFTHRVKNFGSSTEPELHYQWAGGAPSLGVLHNKVYLDIPIEGPEAFNINAPNGIFPRIRYLNSTAAAVTLTPAMNAKVLLLSNTGDVTITVPTTLGAGFNMAIRKMPGGTSRILFAPGDINYYFAPGHTGSDTFEGATITIDTPDGTEFYITGATA